MMPPVIAAGSSMESRCHVETRVCAGGRSRGEATASGRPPQATVFSDAVTTAPNTLPRLDTSLLRVGPVGRLSAPLLVGDGLKDRCRSAGNPAGLRRREPGRSSSPGKSALVIVDDLGV